MAAARRVQLTTLPCDVPSTCEPPASAHNPAPTPPLGQDRPAGTGTGTGTLRLVLALFEPDERRFPEFSYSSLLTDSQVSQSEVKGQVNKSEEERENDEVAAIARRLEEKYGAKQKKKTDRIQDLIDIGYGYDEEDSFIDNTEAVRPVLDQQYDEFVPASITPEFGGFYVNSGELQFRQASDSEAEDIPADAETFAPPKKRKINGGQDKPKKKKRRAEEGMKSNVHSTSSTLSATGQTDEVKRKKKKRKGVATLSVTSMLKKFLREKQKEHQKMETAAGIPQCPADAAGGGGSGLTDPLLSLIGSTDDLALVQAASTMDIDIDLVSLLDASEEVLSPNVVPQPATETQLFQPQTISHSQFNVLQAPPPHIKTNVQPQQIQLPLEATSAPHHPPVPPPEGLTPGLEDSVGKLMVAVKASEGESKLKFFTPEINAILLDIELQCREQGSQLRSKLYTHLSSFLPCSRDTLLKRVKKLILTHPEEPPDVEDDVQKLKEAILKAMPEQIASYDAQCQRYEQVRASKAAEEGNESRAIEDSVEERGVKRGGPKKVFKWNDEIRECLCVVLKPKLDRYEKEGNRRQEVEEYLKTLLDGEVKRLWPKGWMQSRALIRESRKLLGFFTSVPVRKARSEKQQPCISGASTVLHGTPPLKGEFPLEMGDVFNEASIISSSPALDVKTEAAALQNLEGNIRAVDAGSSTPTVSGDTPVRSASAPALSLLDLLAEQALAREQPLVLSQEQLAAAIAKYKHSVSQWNFGGDTKSPPPPPHSSPVGFPMSRVCPVVLPQTVDITRNLDAGQGQIISEDFGITIQ